MNIVELESLVGPCVAKLRSSTLRCALRVPKRLSEVEFLRVTKLGGGFKYFLFSPHLGMIPILTSIFFNWVGSTTN